MHFNWPLFSTKLSPPLAVAQHMALTGLMAILNLLIFLLSVPLKMTEVLRRKCGRPERNLRRPVVSSLFGSKSIMKRRLMTTSAPRPLSGTWNMQVSDGESQLLSHEHKLLILILSCYCICSCTF